MTEFTRIQSRNTSEAVKRKAITANIRNGKTGPDTTPLVVRQGDRVRIWLINLGMDHHPIHLHGRTFQVTGTEAGRIPESARIPGNTVLVGVAQARDIEFVADNPGNWMLHCYLPTT